MAKGDQTTQDNANLMRMNHAPLDASLGSLNNGFGTRFGGADIPMSGIAPSQSAMPSIIGGGNRFTPGMGLPNSGQVYNPAMMAGPGSATRMTGGGFNENVNSPIAPTDQNELIRRIMMMSRF